jgi:hypothetical protein
MKKDQLLAVKLELSATDYGPAETAANAIFTNDDVLELMDELGPKVLFCLP